MATDSADPLFLVEFFREFYASVLSHRSQIEQAMEPAPEEDSIQIREADILAEEALPATDRSELAPDVIQAQLFALLEEQTQAVQRRGDVREQKRFSEIQYVMTAMADEVFLSIEWSGKEFWSSHLMEERMFGTHDAGSRFFENLDALLRQRDATRADVLAVYLLALSLGFRGKHRGVSTDAQIAHYRNQAYVTLFQRNPGLPESAPLFPQAYAHTRGGQTPSWLPQLRPWVLSLVMVAVGYLVISYLIWDRRSTAVAARLEELNSRRAPAQLPTQLPANRGGAGGSGSGPGAGARSGGDGRSGGAPTASHP